jgi:hypothetical protein
MLEVEVFCHLRGVVDRLLHEGSVVRVNPLENALDGRCDRTVVLEDSKSLVRPDDLAGGRLPAEASRMAEALRFREVRLTPLRGFRVRVGNRTMGARTFRTGPLTTDADRSASVTDRRRALPPPTSPVTAVLQGESPLARRLHHDSPSAGERRSG